MHTPRLRAACDKHLDTLKTRWLVMPCLLLACFINYDSTFYSNTPLDASPVQVSPAQ
jgi:hypothetical protein